MTQKPRNADYTREYNRKAVLRILRRQAMSRAELARATGLTRAAASLIVEELLNAGVVTELAPQSAGRGRSATPLALRPDSYYALAVDLARKGCTVGLCDIGGNLLQCRELPEQSDMTDAIAGALASLLESVDGPNRERDLCILTLFLNCGLRISELIGLNLSDVHEDALRVLGKGNKVRMVYLNQACLDTLRDYLAVRRPITGPDRDALFLSARNQRISRSMVNALVKKHLSQAGLDSTQYSSHKLRHTAATLMLQNGVDVRAVQEVLGHEHLNTTEIYTHIDNEALRVAAKANPLSQVKTKGKIKDDDN